MKYIIASVIELIGCVLLFLAICFYELYRGFEWVAIKVNAIADRIVKKP